MKTKKQSLPGERPGHEGEMKKVVTKTRKRNKIAKESRKKNR